MNCGRGLLVSCRPKQQMRRRRSSRLQWTRERLTRSPTRATILSRVRNGRVFCPGKRHPRASGGKLMQAQRIVWHWFAALVLLGSCRTGVFSGEARDKEDLSKSLPPKVAKAWRDAGARVGWIRFETVP